MAAKRRHWKEKNGRYWARLAIPERLRPAFGGKSELNEPLGGDKRLTDRNHPAAVARIRAKLSDAEHSLKALPVEQQSVVTALTPAAPLTEEMMAQLIWNRFIKVLDDDSAKRGALPTDREIEAEEAKLMAQIDAGELDASGPGFPWINGYPRDPLLGAR